MSSEVVIVRQGRDTAGRPWSFSLSSHDDPRRPQTYPSIEHASARVRELEQQAACRGVAVPVWTIVPTAEAPPTFT